MIVETGGFNQNSSWFIGYLPNGEEYKCCLESDWREAYNEMFEKMEAEKEKKTSNEDES